MSALPPKADIRQRNCDVRFGPNSDIAQLFDHLVGAGKYCWRNCEAQLLRDFKIDHQLEVGRRTIGGHTIDPYRVGHSEQKNRPNEIGDAQNSLKMIKCSHPGSPKPT